MIDQPIDPPSYRAECAECGAVVLDTEWDCAMCKDQVPLCSDDCQDEHYERKHLCKVCLEHRPVLDHASVCDYCTQDAEV